MPPTKRSETKADQINCDATAGEGIIASLTELRDALKNGEKIEKKFTMRTVDLELEPQDYTPEDVKRTRELFNVSQAVFAKLLGVRPKTVQSWEQGLIPPKMARRLLDFMNKDPESWIEMLKESARNKIAH